MAGIFVVIRLIAVAPRGLLTLLEQPICLLLLFRLLVIGTLWSGGRGARMRDFARDKLLVLLIRVDQFSCIRFS